MTDRVSPNYGGTARARLAAGAIAYGGGVRSDGWVAPATTEYYAADAGLVGAPLGGFAATTSAASLTVTIASGEGFVGGYWFGRDATTDVTLASNTSNQTVYAGVNVDATDAVIVGLDAAFAADDPQIPLYDITTDASGVTGRTDRRITEPPDAPTGTWETIYTAKNTSQTTGFSFDTGTIADPYDYYRVWVQFEDESGAENYAKMRVNGHTSADYEYDYYNGSLNEHASSGLDDKFNYICGATANGFGTSTVTLSFPQQFYSEGPGTIRDHPKIAVGQRHLEKNIEHIMHGQLVSVGYSSINRIRLYTTANATGAIVVEGSNKMRGL